MLKVKIEERYLKSFEWLLQCYQYLFYFDSGAEVSFDDLVNPGVRAGPLNKSEDE